VRRVLASLLLAVFGFSLIAPALLADDSNLPACCRRLGEHHCAMANMQSAGQSLSAIQEKCPQYPNARAVPVNFFTMMPTPSQAIFASLVGRPAPHAQTEVHWRVSFSRAWQKRGPPALLS
jgi:hypothetical protein